MSAAAATTKGADTPAGDATAADHVEASKPSIAGAINLLKSLHLPGHAPLKDSEGAAVAAATLSEVAGIITTLAKDHLGSLLVHPGHATLGVYFLARRHELTRLADNIDGSSVGDKELVEDLIRYVDLSDCIYPDRYPVLVEEQKLIKESDILFFFTQVHKLQPGFMLALDRQQKKLLWIIRGTHDIHDLLTDLCGVATPLPSPAYPTGSAAHWGMWRAAGWLLEQHWSSVLKHLNHNPGFDLEIIGHSMGGGVGALLALRLNSEEQFQQDLGSRKATCMGIASAACLTGELATACAPYVTTLVMRYDLVPRFSTAAVEAMQEELLEIDYKALLHEELLEHEVYRQTVERTKSAAAKVMGHKLTKAAVAKTTQQLSALQAGVEKAKEVLAHHIDTAKANIEAHMQAQHQKGGAPSAAAAAAAAGAPGAAAAAEAGAAAAAGAAVAGGVSGQTASKQAGSSGAAVESFDDAGEAEEAAAAAAAGDIVAATLYAPGRLLFVKPIDETVAEEDHKFELVDGHGDQRFKRIVLRSSCMTDHWPATYKMGLSDVLASVSKKQASIQQQQGQGQAQPAA